MKIDLPVTIVASAALPARATEAAVLVRAFYGDDPTPEERAAGTRAYQRFRLLVSSDRGGFLGVDDETFEEVGPRLGLSMKDRAETARIQVEWQEMSAAVKDAEGRAS